MTYRNVISIVYNGVISAGKVYPQEDETGILAESYLIHVKNGDNIPFRANQYMAQVIEKVIYPHYSWEFLAIWNNRVEHSRWVSFAAYIGAAIKLYIRHIRQTS